MRGTTGKRDRIWGEPKNIATISEFQVLEEVEEILYNRPGSAMPSGSSGNGGGAPGHGRSLKRFSGEDPEELKSWKAWATAELLSSAKKDG